VNLVRVVNLRCHTQPALVDTKVGEDWNRRGDPSPPSTGYGTGPTSDLGALPITNASDNNARVYSSGPG